MIRPRSLSLFVGTGLILASAAAGQKAASSPSSPLFKTQANLVLVDVVVTGHGQPILGLKESGFRIYDQGQEQKLTVFEEHRATDAIQAAPVPKLPPGVYSNYPQFTETAAANVLLLDALNTPLPDQKYSRLRMLRYLNTIPQGTQIAVFTLSSKLRMITGFTTDAAAIARALGPGRGNAQKSPVRDPQFVGLMNGVAELAKSAGANPQMIAAMRQLAADTTTYQMDQRMQITMDAMQELARYLSTVPGRKNLIWLSGSFPGTVAPDYTQTDPTRTERDYLAAVMRTDELMARARVAVYPVDVRGLMDLYSSDTGTEDNPCNGVSACNPAGKEEQLEKDFLYRNFAEHTTMDQIAHETGGKAFYNTNGLGDDMTQAIANGSNYYTLGYIPTNRNYNGAFRRIRVEVKGEHERLQYRQGYYANSPTEEARRLPNQIGPVVAAMQPGAPPLSQLIFEARVTSVGVGSPHGAGISGSTGKIAQAPAHPIRCRLLS